MVLARAIALVLIGAVCSAAAASAARSPPPPDGCFPLTGSHHLATARGLAPAHARAARRPPPIAEIRAAEGTPVLAPLDGVVIQRGSGDRGAGLYLRVRASHGEDYVLMHLRPRSIIARRGTPVRAGDFLAQVGRTGSVLEPSLGIAVWRRRGGRSEPLDPLATLAHWEHTAC